MQISLSTATEPGRSRIRMEMVPVMAVEIARTARMEMGAAIIPALIQIKSPSTDDKNNGNNNSDNNNGGSDNKRPSATAKDPEVKKEWNNRVDGVTDHSISG